jgi:hypothetical protein
VRRSTTLRTLNRFRVRRLPPSAAWFQCGAVGALLAALMVVPATTAGATTSVTLYVSQHGVATSSCLSSGEGACTTLAEGVAAAELLTSDDVTIDVAASPTAYDANVIIADDNPQITIAGAGAASTTLNGTNSGSIIVTSYSSVVVVTGFTLTGGDAAYGGAVENEGTFTASNDDFSNNIGGDYGGGLYNDGGTVTLTDDLFSDNYGYYGGGLASNGPATVTDDTFSGNTAVAAAGFYNFPSRTATISNDTFSSDTASTDGGGLENQGTATLTNDTFFHDGATNGAGGAIFTDSTGSVTTLTESTIAFDTDGTTYGPGLFNDLDTSFSVADSILDSAGCSRYSEANAFTDGGYNVESDDDCGFASTDRVDSATIDLATALAANGATGPETLALGAASSAVNLVPRASCSVATDERGVVRLASSSQSACDAGAYEFKATVPTAPLKLTPKAGNKSIALTWSAPTSNGGLALTGYRLYCSKLKPVPTKVRATALTKANVRAFKVGGLINNVHYNCVVFATNALGASVASNNAGATPKV